MQLYHSVHLIRGKQGSPVLAGSFQDFLLLIPRNNVVLGDPVASSFLIDCFALPAHLSIDMGGSKLNNRNYNVKYKLPGQLNQPRGPTPPPVDPKYPPERAEDEEEGPSQKTGQYWYYSDHAGGMVLPYRKHHGEKMHSVPLSYLKWCYNKLTYAVRTPLHNMNACMLNVRSV